MKKTEIIREYLTNNDCSDKTKVDIAKEIIQQYNLDVPEDKFDGFRRFVQKVMDRDFDKTTTQTNQYKNDKEKKIPMMSAMKPNGMPMNIDEYCEHYGFDRDKIRSYKSVTHNGIAYFNIAFYESSIERSLEIDFAGILDRLKPIEVEEKPVKIGLFDRVVYTDAHIGMQPNEDGFSLYGGKWDEEEIEERLKILVNKVIQEQKSNTLYIDDLGDLADGWDGRTTRGGHELPQNMSNQEVYDVGVSFKIRMIDELIKHYDKIICNNICDDNHSHSFGYIINSGFKTAMSIKYPKNVEVHNHRKFITHYTVGKHVFILSHGKDSKHLKFGFKPVLDATQIEKITNYIDEHFLYTKGAVIEFSKGDSHQWLFDNSTSDKFNYYNYPAFSPSSGYIQTNFKKGISGFICFNYFKDQNKTTHEYLFDWVGK